MTWWQYLLLVNLYLLLFYGFYALLLRKETFFQMNRVYLVSSALLSFFIPMIHSNWVENLFITQKVEHSLAAYTSPEIVYQFNPIEDHHITIGQIMLSIYAAGALFLAIKFAWQLVSLKKMIDQPDQTSAFSFFKSIRVNKTEERQDVIIAHEEVHVREWHSADVMLMEAITIINWFNPVVYFYRLGIKHIHEFIADKQAINNGVEKSEYALLLLSQTLKTPAHQLVNPFFNHSLLKRRIMMLQKNRSQRAALLKYGLSAPLFILMLILSSATISKSHTVKIINKKAEEVFLTPASPSDSLADVSSQADVSKAKEVKVTNLLYRPKQVTVADTTPKKGIVFTAVERSPEFKGGIEAFYQFLQQNLRYPAEMRKNNIQGKVFITFIVEEDGSLSNFRVLRDVGYGSAEETERVFRLSPKWNPGLQNGRSVRVQFTMPVSFTLAQGDKTNLDTTKKTGYIDINPTKVKYGSATLNPVDSDKNIRIKNVAVNGIQPLYILDGQEIPDLKNVSPNSIESIAILKPKNNDDSMVELYGAKALNGVVVIKSKKAAASH